MQTDTLSLYFQGSLECSNGTYRMMSLYRMFISFMKTGSETCISATTGGSKWLVKLRYVKKSQSRKHNKLNVSCIYNENRLSPPNLSILRNQWLLVVRMRLLAIICLYDWERVWDLLSPVFSLCLNQHTAYIWGASSVIHWVQPSYYFCFAVCHWFQMYQVMKHMEATMLGKAGLILIFEALHHLAIIWTYEQ